MTPLRALLIVWMYVFIDSSIMVYQIEQKGYEPGLGGLAPMAAGLTLLVTVVADVILTFALERKKNLIIQTILIILLGIWIWMN